MYSIAPYGYVSARIPIKQLRKSRCRDPSSCHRNLYTGYPVGWALPRMVVLHQGAHKKNHRPIAGVFGQIIKFAGRFGIVLLFVEGK